MKPLNELYLELESFKAILDKNMADVPYGNREAINISKVQAKIGYAAKLEELEKEIVPNKLVGLFLSGNVEDTLSFVSKNGGIVIDANAVYKKMAADVEPSFGVSRDFGPSQWSIMADSYCSLWGDFNQERFPPDYLPNLDLSSPYLHIKKMITAWEGTELATTLTRKAILDEIVSKKLISQVLVVVVGVGSKKEQKDFEKLFSKSVEFVAPEGFVPNKMNINKILKNKEEE